MSLLAASVPHLRSHGGLCAAGNAGIGGSCRDHHPVSRTCPRGPCAPEPTHRAAAGGPERIRTYAILVGSLGRESFHKEVFRRDVIETLTANKWKCSARCKKRCAMLTKTCTTHLPDVLPHVTVRQAPDLSVYQALVNRAPNISTVAESVARHASTH